MSSKLQAISAHELEYISQAVNAGLKGAWVKKFEEDFAKKFTVEYAIGVNSGTSALHAALYAVGVQAGDEVIVPPITFAAPAFAALALGAIPVFADIDPGTFIINPASIKQKISSATKAIIPVSLYGLPSPIEEILELAHPLGIKVIEDNAECFLGKHCGHIAGSQADMSIFSLQKTKHMTCENGGVIITNDESLAERARKFSILGYTTLKAKSGQAMLSPAHIQQPTFLRHAHMGFNYRLPELCAAVACAQLERLEEMVKQRQMIGELYREAIKDCPWLVEQKTPVGYEHSEWTFVIRLDTDKTYITWQDFKNVFVEKGGEPFYAAWAVNYLEPFLLNKTLTSHAQNITYARGLCPIAEKYQPQLMQLKTNFADLDYAQKQADILYETIDFFERTQRSTQVVSPISFL